MYKLENNVEWTTDLKNAFKHNITRASIFYIDDNDEEVELNENNHLVDLTLEDDRYIDGVGFIGSACARKLDITIQDTNNDLNLENKELTLKIGADYNGSTYYINYGNFIVNEPPQIDETNGKTKITAYDYMIKFNQPYLDRINYPTTLSMLLQDICSQAGVTLGSNSFRNYDFVVTDNQFSGATLRAVLQNIGKCAFSWARIGQDNKLYLDFSKAAESTETLTIDDYKTNAFKKSKEYYGPVNQVTYADSNIEGQEDRVRDQQSIAENGLKELVIYDNLFGYTPEKRAQLIQAGTYLFGLTYMPVSQLDSIGFIFLDCNDIINIETLDNQSYTTRVFNHIIKYSGTTSDSIISQGTSNNEEIYKNTATNVFQNQQTRIIVDKANKTINSIVEEIGDRSQKTTTITQDIDGISSKVENIQDLTVTVSGYRTIVLEDCMKGELLNLNIIGNNTVFDYLYPEDDLYPSDDLYPRGDARIVVSGENGNSVIYDLRVEEVLRANGDTYDEYVLQNNDAKIIRRINKDGTIKVEPEEEDIGQYTIYLEEGQNTISIQNYGAQISARFIQKNSYTDQFATTVKMNSAITQSASQILSTVSAEYETKENAETNYSQINQTASEISTEVSKKVGNNEVISKINQSAEAVSINANKININGVISANGNFKVDTNGNMTCNNGTFNGGKLRLAGGSESNPDFRIGNNTDDGVFITDRTISLATSGSNYAYISTFDNNTCQFLMYSGNNRGVNFNLGSDVISLNVNDVRCRRSVHATEYLYDSKAEIKKDINKYYGKALDIIQNSTIYEFNYIKTPRNKKTIGFVIGEKYKTPDEIINDERDGINSYSAIGIMWKAIQEQQEEIETLKEEIKRLKGEQNG